MSAPFFIIDNPEQFLTPIGAGCGKIGNFNGVKVSGSCTIPFTPPMSEIQINAMSGEDLGDPVAIITFQTGSPPTITGQLGPFISISANNLNLSIGYSNSYAFNQAANEALILMEEAQNNNLSFSNISALIASLNSLYNMMNPAPSSSDGASYAVYQAFSLDTKIGSTILEVCQSPAAFSYLFNTDIINDSGSFGQLYNSLSGVPNCSQDICTASLQCAVFGDGKNACGNITSMIGAIKWYNAHNLGPIYLSSSLIGVATAIRDFNKLTINDGNLTVLQLYLQQNTVDGVDNTDLITLSNSLLSNQTSTIALDAMKLGLDLLKEYNSDGGTLLSMLNEVKSKEFSNINYCPSNCPNPSVVMNQTICPCGGVGLQGCPGSGPNCVIPS